MTLATGAWGQDTVAQNGKDMRELVEGLVGVDGITTKPGFTLGFKAAAQGSPNATVSVALGWALVAASGAGLGGMYHVWNDAALNSGSFAATSGNGRWDYLILRVTAGVPALEIVQGTASGSPVAPTITGDNYLPIALVKLPASTSAVTNAMINDARVFTGHWTEPWGLVAAPALNTTGTGATIGSSITDLPGLSVSFNGVAHRRYRITAQGVFQQGVGGASVSNTYIRDGSNTTLNTIGQSINAGFFFSVYQSHYAVASVAGTLTYKWSATFTSFVGGLSASATQYASFIVEDVGPAANPD